MKLIVNVAILSLLSIVALISEIGCQLPRKKKIRDNFVDFVFMVDKSLAMRNMKFDLIHKAIIEWIDAYSDTTGSGSSQFAAITCAYNKVKVQHYFDEKNYSQAISWIFAHEVTPILTELYDNWHQCLNNVSELIFVEAKGHRKNATGVAVFVTACAFDMLNRVYKPLYVAEAENFMRKSLKTKFAFICALLEPPAVYFFNKSGESGANYIENMLSILNLTNQSSESIILSQPGVSIVAEINKIIPEVEIDVFDCVWNLTCDVCFLRSNDNKCLKNCSVKIYQQPTPQGNPCIFPDNKKDNIFESCDNCNDSEGTFATPSQKDLYSPPKSYLAMILAILGGLLLLVIILIILAICIKKRREKKKYASHGVQSKEKDEKNKGVSIDIQDGSKYVSEGGQSAEGRENKKGVSVDIPKPKPKTGSRAASAERPGNSGEVKKGVGSGRGQEVKKGVSSGGQEVKKGVSSGGREVKKTSSTEAAKKSGGPKSPAPVVAQKKSSPSLVKK